MASLTDQNINNTYSGLIKTCDSGQLPSTGKTVLTDGLGNESSLEIGKCGQGATIKGTAVVTGDISQCNSTCTSTLGIVNICDTLEVTNNTCLNGNLNVTGDTCTGGDNYFGTADNTTCIPGMLAVGGPTAACTKITSRPTCSNEAGLFIESSNISPFIRFCETTNNKTFSIGLDASNNSNFKISTGNSVNGSNNFVIDSSGRVNINTGSGTDNLTVGGTGKFTGNLTSTGNLNLQVGGLNACNGLGTSGQLLQSTGTKIQWVSPGGGALCTGNICGGGTGERVPKWSNSSTLIDSSIYEEGNSVFIDKSLIVCCNTVLQGFTKLNGVVYDSCNNIGNQGQLLESTGSGVRWVTNTGTSCTGNIGGGGTVNTLSKFTGGSSIGDSVIKESSGNVGIGINPDPSYKLNVSGNVKASNFIGNLTGNINSSTTVGGNMTASGAVKGSSISNANGSAVMSSGGQITATSVTAGTICATSIIRSSGDIIAFSSSDKRLKDNLTCITNSNNIINSLNGYCFDWNDKSDREGSSTGLIAQEVQKVLPTAVCERENGYLAVDYIQLIPVMIEELKRLNEKINKLQN